MKDATARNLHSQLDLGDKNSRETYLKAVSLFADIKDNHEAMSVLVDLMVVKSYQPNAVIIQEGTTGTEMFFLVSGKAAVYKSTLDGDQYKVAVIDSSSHAFFGEGSLIDSETRSATIKSETHCQCLLFDRKAFDQFAKDHSNWALPIFQRIACVVMNRLRKTSNDLLLLYNALVAEIRGQ